MDPNSHDLLRPDFLLSSQTLTHSKSRWHASLSLAQSATNLPYSCSNVKVLLNKTPSIPQCTEVAECAGNNFLSLEGYSKWLVLPADKSSRSTCELSRFKKNLPRHLCIANSHPKTCKLSAEYIPEWTGFQPLQEPVGNYLCAFVLGWSYILSARMIELRRRTADDKLVYTNNHAQWDRREGDQDGDYFDLDIGSNDIAAVQWWAAILADGRGWEATLARDGKEYYPPNAIWTAVHLDYAIAHKYHPRYPPSHRLQKKPWNTFTILPDFMMLSIN